MASAIYPKFKEQILQGGVDLSTADVRAMLIDTADYSYAGTHEFRSDVVAAGQEELLPSGMTTKTFTDGTFDADDITFTGTSGDDCEAIILYTDTGSDTTDRLIAYLDSGSISGLPVTLGGDVTIQWDAAGIFTI